MIPRRRAQTTSTGTERDLPSIAHTITPQPEATLAPIQAGIPNAEISHQTAGAHELTSVLNTGEMISEAPAPPTPSEIPEPTSPLQHETAVLETSAEPEITTFVSPSHGTVVEEEMLDEEEDFNATTLHASSIEEMDYEEEQTLEGAADLGTMIREMSIDQITQGSVDPEDDDILEEEDATEDDFNDSYEASHDEEEDDDEESAPGFHEAAGEPEEFGTAGAGRPDLPYLADRSPAPGASSNASTTRATPTAARAAAMADVVTAAAATAAVTAAVTVPAQPAAAEIARPPAPAVAMAVTPPRPQTSPPSAIC